MTIPLPVIEHGPRMEVPGGWVYCVGHLFHPVYVPDPAVWVQANDTAKAILAAVATVHQEIITMSTTLSGQLDASTAKLQADFATMTTGIGVLNTELTAALAGVTPGSTITQAQVDALTAVQTSMDTLAASLPTSAAGTLPLPGAA